MTLPAVTAQKWIVERIEQERIYLGLSMSDLADASGLSRTQVYRLLRYGQEPRISTLALLLAAVGLTLKVQRAAGSGKIEGHLYIEEGRRRANVPTPGTRQIEAVDA